MTPAPRPGPVMFDIQDLALSDQDRRRLRHPAAGGIILFARNYASPVQLRELIAAVRSIHPEILIAVDHEGGRVQRFREGFTRLPAAARYLECSGEDLSEAAGAARTAGWLMAAELRAFDVDFSFAPVLDVDLGISRIIGDRAFSHNPHDVAVLALGFYEGMRQAGMAGVGKHFPGHGAVAEDSHLDLPVDERPFSEIDGRDLVPFRALIGAGLEGIMPAHMIYSACDPRPAGFSPFWLGEVLRQRLDFRGAIFSDDLSMAAAAGAGDFAARTRAALEAGCDVVLACNSPAEIDRVLECAADWPDPARAKRLERMRGRFAVEYAHLVASEAWQSAAAAIQRMTEAAAEG